MIKNDRKRPNKGTNNKMYKADDLEQETKLIVLAREEHRCFICYKKGVDVHEIVPRSAFGKSKKHILFSEKNRVCLCREHHKTAHTFEMRQYLIKMLSTAYGYSYQEQEFYKYLEHQEDDTNNA